MSDKTSYVWLGILIVVTLVFVVLDHCEATPIDACDIELQAEPAEEPTINIEGRNHDMTAGGPEHMPPPVDLDDLERRLRKWMPAEEVDEHMRRLRDAGD